VYYEDLAANPSESMQQICRFLDVPYEPRMTSLAGADRSAIEGGEGQHHARLWCDAIAAEARQDELISPALRCKIDRYICRWRRKYAGRWPRHPVEVSEANHQPGLAELWRDRVIYQFLAAWDEMVKLVYALAPLGATHWYRQWVQQRSLEADYSRSRNETLSQAPVFATANEEIEIHS
jgi:hypothetical protein